MNNGALKKKILLLGGLGFIGKNLYIGLCSQGYNVDIVSDIPLDANDVFINYLKQDDLIIGNICDKNYLENIVSCYSAIYCLAGLSGAVDSLNRPFFDNEVNCIGHLNILEACKEHNPKAMLIFPSSRLVYGKPLYLPVDEKHKLNPESFYAIHKMTAEQYYMLYHRLYGIKSIVLRISNLYGAFQQPNQCGYGILNWFIRQALRGKKINVFGDGTQRRDYLYIGDLVNLFIMLLDQPNVFGDIYNVGSGCPVSLHKGLDTIRDLIPKTSWVFTPWRLKDKAIETGDYISNIDKIIRKTAWSPVTDFYQGMERTVRQYRLQTGNGID